MRVHRLRLSAFGPFADEISVDLDEVGRDGLFLLWGPTGAGKTTLLDAVVFALYGTVPGARGEEKRLRSDHAGEQTRTMVELELTLGGERLRVVRRPEQQRPKRRGAGWTTEQARLTVERATDAGWEGVSTRIDEGSEFLREQLGLSAEQFCQVVLLPQGDFARFLRAEPEDRARLLRTLFDVGRFARAEDWLVEQRGAARERLQGVRTRAGTLVSLVAQAADVPVPEELAPEVVGAGAGASVAAWVQRVRAEAGRVLALVEARAEQAAAEAAGHECALAAARGEAERHQRRDRARAELARLEAEEAELTPLRTRLDAGRRAEPVRDALEAAGRAGAAARTAAATLEAARNDWARVAAGREADGLLARVLRDEAAEVRALLPELARADRLAGEAVRAAELVGRLEERCAEGKAAAGGWAARIAEHETRVAAAAEAAALLPALTDEVGRRRAAVDAARSAGDLEPVVTADRAAADHARSAWLDAREHWGDLRARRFDGMAAELAANLADGVDCPVCGATEHPRPARSAAAVVTREDEEAARVAVDEAEARHTLARSVLADHERELALLRARAGTEPVDVQQQCLADIEAERGRREREAADLDTARAALARLSTQRDTAAAALVADREQLGRRRAELAAAEESLTAVRARLVAAQGDDRDLAARIRRLTTEAERCEALVDAQAAELRARVAAEEARATAAGRAGTAGFESPAAAFAALLDRADATRIGRLVEEHDRARLVVTATLAEPELADLGPHPDVEVLTARCRAATELREGAVAELEAVRRRVARLDQLAGELTAVGVALDECRTVADQVTALADLATGRGSNRLRMRLQSFVLAGRLEQVSEVASLRLLEMSDGRYTFLHSDAQGRNGARGGLALDVLDEYTGVRRPTKTLSGGESFMASLALALGLADVVTAESGGVRIDTLFVDEGFGTLDSRALDAVMDVLDDLRRGGRTVGVISHVEELRTRITSRLEVVPGRHGSRLAG
jgi:exonuclease SbcC